VTNGIVAKRRKRYVLLLQLQRSDRRPGVTSANDHFSCTALHLQLGTLCFLLSSTVTLSQYLNLG